MREADTSSGWCSACVVERAAELYAAEDRRRAAERAKWAGLRNGVRVDAQLAKLRQERHRLTEAIRPRVGCDLYDPWAIAHDAIRYGRTLNRVHELEPILEAIRRLAWGPDGATVVRRSGRTHRELEGQLTLWPTEVLEAVAA